MKCFIEVSHVLMYLTKIDKYLFVNCLYDDDEDDDDLSLLTLSFNLSCKISGRFVMQYLIIFDVAFVSESTFLFSGTSFSSSDSYNVFGFVIFVNIITSLV